MEAPLDLRGARALVTGGATRVGQAISRALSEAGLDVALHYHQNQASADALVKELEAKGRRAFAFAADLSRRSENSRLVEQASAALGGLDLLVINAASFERIPWNQLDDAAWDRTLELNLTSAFQLSRHAAPALRAARGSIVMITCVSSITPFRNYLPYVVSKGALSQLMRALAVELAPDVRVNAVAPGTVQPPSDLSDAIVQRLAATAPLGRIGSASDVAQAVLFLAQAGFVTGQELAVDGGRSLTRFEG